MRRRRLLKGERALPPVHPNVGLRVRYSKRIRALVREMAASYEHWLKASYRANPPATIAEDAATDELERALRRVGIRWQKRFAQAAPELAAFFANAVSRQSEAALRRILRDSGVTVRFKLTPELREVLKATVAENVSLIRSVQQQYHSQVEGLVMRSVAEGRDLASLARGLRYRFDVTEDRAKFISLDQNNKATSAVMREKQLAVGLEEGIWMHSHAGKEPRPTHVANDGQRFSIREGWYDPDPKVRKRIWPGMLPRCRCTWRPVVKGFS
jgi:uncharacterized protein with gpF-like domain